MKDRTGNQMQSSQCFPLCSIRPLPDWGSPPLPHSHGHTQRNSWEAEQGCQRPTNRMADFPRIALRVRRNQGRRMP